MQNKRLNQSFSLLLIVTAIWYIYKIQFDPPNADMAAIELPLYWHVITLFLGGLLGLIPAIVWYLFSTNVLDRPLEHRD